jgi:hypothetical protein
MATVLWLGYLKDLLQCLFFVVTGALAVLTYLGARRTLLQPLRTEVFKEQLKLLTRVLEEFEGKGSMDLLMSINVQAMVVYNVKELAAEYGKNVLGVPRTLLTVEPPPVLRPDAPSVGGIIILEPPEDLVTRFGKELLSRWSAISVVEPLEENEDQELKGDLPWESYWYNFVHVPKEYYQTTRRITLLLDSPVMPSKCVELLKGYLTLLSRIPSGLAKELTALAQELPDLCPDKETLLRLNPYAFHGRLVRALPELEEVSQKIIEFARSYLEPDRLTR